jgi:hypothetical protein
LLAAECWPKGVHTLPSCADIAPARIQCMGRMAKNLELRDIELRTLATTVSTAKTPPRRPELPHQAQDTKDASPAKKSKMNSQQTPLAAKQGTGSKKRKAAADDELGLELFEISDDDELDEEFVEELRMPTTGGRVRQRKASSGEDNNEDNDLPEIDSRPHPTPGSHPTPDSHPSSLRRSRAVPPLTAQFPSTTSAHSAGRAQRTSTSRKDTNAQERSQQRKKPGITVLPSTNMYPRMRNLVRRNNAIVVRQVPWPMLAVCQVAHISSQTSTLGTWSNTGGLACR